MPIQYKQLHQQQSCGALNDVVVRVRAEWGDYLVSQKQMDAACNHYIQAGAHLKAINSAIEASQWSKVCDCYSASCQTLPTSSVGAFIGHRFQHCFAEPRCYLSHARTQASSILDSLDGAAAKPYMKRIAKHFADVKNYAVSVQFLLGFLFRKFRPRLFGCRDLSCVLVHFLFLGPCDVRRCVAALSFCRLS
jgi:hypothetical protein